jgi:methionine-rich copper-binding protein CopC
MRRQPEASLRTFAIALGAAVVVSSAAALLSSAPAFGHAGYESSTPSDGEVVAESPAVVDVFFTQEIARSGGLPTMIVVNDAGDVIADQPVLDDEDRAHISIELPPALPDRRYTVIWHTLSDDDGEEARGAFHFYIGSGPSPTTTDGETPAPDGESTPSPAASQPATEDDDDDGGGEPWLVFVGIAGGLVVGGGAGWAAGRRRSA